MIGSSASLTLSSELPRRFLWAARPDRRLSLSLSLSRLSRPPLLDPLLPRLSPLQLLALWLRSRRWWV
jgi:hypothetical protein